MKLSKTTSSVVDDPDGGSTATWVFGAALKP